MIEVGTLQSGGGVQTDGREYVVEPNTGWITSHEAAWRVMRGGAGIGMVLPDDRRFAALTEPSGDVIGWYDTVLAACEGLVDYFELMAGEIEL